MKDMYTFGSAIVETTCDIIGKSVNNVTGGGGKKHEVLCAMASSSCCGFYRIK